MLVRFVGRRDADSLGVRAVGVFDTFTGTYSLSRWLRIFQ